MHPVPLFYQAYKFSIGFQIVEDNLSAPGGILATTGRIDHRQNAVILPPDAVAWGCADD
jgi:hypothetical protein